MDVAPARSQGATIRPESASWEVWLLQMKLDQQWRNLAQWLDHPMRGLRPLFAMALVSALLGYLPDTKSADQRQVQAQACPGPNAPVAEPYRWYPALDL